MSGWWDGGSSPCTVGDLVLPRSLAGGVAIPSFWDMVNEKCVFCEGDGGWKRGLNRGLDNSIVESWQGESAI